MELKQCINRSTKTGNILLIVPYGIETIIDELEKENEELLIVPYGIETWRRKNGEQHLEGF